MNNLYLIVVNSLTCIGVLIAFFTLCVQIKKDNKVKKSQNKITKLIIENLVDEIITLHINLVDFSEKILKSNHSFNIYYNDNVVQIIDDINGDEFHFDIYSSINMQFFNLNHYLDKEFIEKYGLIKELEKNKILLHFILTHKNLIDFNEKKELILSIKSIAENSVVRFNRIKSDISIN
ncbi:hypothetical protein [Proteus sp. CA142267]|uniref:hypothetical protein n=1 Tax=Proteus sp. CA142267 TaxID=2050965 RepID=UPI000D6DC6FA|nr:hypothetical protein [Proteus sp. CA142267]EKW2644227.1 hypothetical protein [Proteus mirabilis]